MNRPNALFLAIALSAVASIANAGSAVPASIPVAPQFVTDWQVELPIFRPLDRHDAKEGRTVPRGADSCVFDEGGRPTDPAAAIERVLAADVVYAGEQHDRPSHHQAQARLLSAMLSRRKSSAGFEMLHAVPVQQRALDAYTEGAIDAAAFQQAVDWPKTWGYSFAWYEPIFNALRANHAPGVALNIPRAIVHKVATSGLGSLTPEERRFVPEAMTRPEDPAYLDMLRETYRQHAPDPADAQAWGRYLDAMTLWNEGMAARVARFLKAHPGTPMLVVAGGFHAVKAAIPAGVARRAPNARQLSIVLVESKDCPDRLPAEQLSPSADLFWFVAP